MRRDRVEIPRILVPWLADLVGVSRARVRTEVRRGNWRMIARGVVLTRPEDPRRGDWAAVGIALAGPTAALTGWDALRVRGLGDATPPPAPVIVLSRHAANRVIGDVRIRETARPYSVRIASAGVADYPLTPIVSVARAVTDAAPAYDRRTPVRALVTSAIQRRLVTVPDLLAELDAAPRNGSGFLRAALADARDGARSEAEAVAARRLGSARLPAFELNVPLVDRAGTLIAVADVLWRQLRAVLEIDSREYHFGEKAWKATMARHNRLTRLGLAVTHYPPSVVTGRSRDWLVEIAGWLDGRAREVGVVPARRGVIRPLGDVPEPLVLAAGRRAA